VHLLIDVSPSMGNGATDADQTLIYNATGCVLACHYSFIGGTQCNSTAARATGAVLRPDVVRQVTQQSINDMKTRAASAGQVRVSIDLYSNSIIPLLALTTDLTAAATAAGNIDFASGLGGSGSETETALAQLGTAIGSSGTGYTPNSRKSYVVLIRDGTQNSIIATTPTSGRQTTPASDPSLAYTAKTPADITLMYKNILDDKLPPSNIALTH
jgi:hypothetical protein